MFIIVGRFKMRRIHTKSPSLWDICLLVAARFCYNAIITLEDKFRRHYNSIVVSDGHLRQRPQMYHLYTNPSIRIRSVRSHLHGETPPVKDVFIQIICFVCIASICTRYTSHQLSFTIVSKFAYILH